MKSWKAIGYGLLDLLFIRRVNDSYWFNISELLFICASIVGLYRPPLPWIVGERPIQIGEDD